MTELRLHPHLAKQPALVPGVEMIPTRDGGMLIAVRKGRKLIDIAEMRDNQFHALIFRGPSGLFGEPGTVEDIGISTNLRTNDGADWQAGSMGALLGNTTGSPATGTGATSLTSTGTSLTSNAAKGRRIFVDNGTGSPIYGNVGSNTTSVFTVDQWWNADDTTATTPSTTAAYSILPGYSPARFIGLTADTGAPAAGDTALTSEINSNGGSRALGTYAHTASATSYTLSKTFNFTGVLTAIHKAGCFTCLTLAATGLMVFETNLNADATVANGDSMATTWTVNI